jgi:hypothetical protein
VFALLDVQPIATQSSKAARVAMMFFTRIKESPSRLGR